GFLIFSENYYPGWRTFVDGEERELIEVEGLVQAVRLKKGVRCIEFSYDKKIWLKNDKKEV
ncbi:MAG: hypothetical protein ABIB11_02745, partial [Candidatus Omnitrophota bacterium]